MFYNIVGNDKTNNNVEHQKVVSLTEIELRSLITLQMSQVR